MSAGLAEALRALEDGAPAMLRERLADDPAPISARDGDGYTLLGAPAGR